MMYTKPTVPVLYYAYVDLYESSGRVCFPCVSKKEPDKKFPCAGAYDTYDEAMEAATTLRDLLRKGEQAHLNAEYYRDRVRSGYWALHEEGTDDYQP
jgi:hypothetical protein